MATKKPKKKSGIFVVTLDYAKSGPGWEDSDGEAQIQGPFTDEEAVKAIEKKVTSGCPRSKITVITGKRMSVELKIK